MEDPDIIDCLPFCPLQPPLDLLGQDHYYTVRPHNGSTTQGLARLRVIHYGKQCNEQRRSLFYYRKKRLPENAISVMVAWLLSNQMLNDFYNSRLGKGFYVPSSSGWFWNSLIASRWCYRKWFPKKSPPLGVWGSSPLASSGLAQLFVMCRRVNYYS